MTAPCPHAWLWVGAPTETPPIQQTRRCPMCKAEETLYVCAARRPCDDCHSVGCKCGCHATAATPKRLAPLVDGTLKAINSAVAPMFMTAIALARLLPTVEAEFAADPLDGPKIRAGIDRLKSELKILDDLARKTAEQATKVLACGVGVLEGLPPDLRAAAEKGLGRAEQIVHAAEQKLSLGVGHRRVQAS